MDEIEARIIRSEAIREFDIELIPYVRAFEANQRHIDRAKQWAHSEADRQELLQMLHELDVAKQSFRLAAAFKWMTQHPDLDPPSFSPRSIRRRMYLRSPSNPFNLYRDWTSRPHLPIKITYPKLIQIGDEVDDIIREYNRDI